MFHKERPSFLLGLLYYLKSFCFLKKKIEKTKKMLKNLKSCVCVWCMCVIIITCHYSLLKRGDTKDDRSDYLLTLNSLQVSFIFTF